MLDAPTMPDPDDISFDLARLHANEVGTIENVKARARIIRDIDVRTGFRRSADITDYCLKHGINLSEHHVRRARKIGALLAALDPDHLDPTELQGVTSATLLYELWMTFLALKRDDANRALRIREFVLDALKHDNPLDHLRLMKRARTTSYPPEDAFTRPFRDVSLPPELTASVQAGFTQWRAAFAATTMQAFESLARHLQDARLYRAIERYAAATGLDRDDALEDMTLFFSLIRPIFARDIHQVLNGHHPEGKERAA